MWFFHNGPLYTSLALSSFCEVAPKKERKTCCCCPYCRRRGAARENNRRAHTPSKSSCGYSFSINMYGIVIIWLPIYCTQTNKQKCTRARKWTVKFEGKSLFFDWWRVVVGVDFKRKNNRQETCFVLHTHTHTSKSGTNETFHTHTKQKCIVV